MKQQKFDIWMEGFKITGQEAQAQLVARNAPGENFLDAARRHYGSDPHFDPEKGTYWGCKLFDNESEARRCFG